MPDQPAVPAAPASTATVVVDGALAKALEAGGIKKPAAPAPAAAAPPPAAAPRLDVETVKRIGQLERENRELKAKAKEAPSPAAPSPELQALTEAKALWGEGKIQEALEKLAGGAVDAQVEALIASYIANPNATTESALEKKVTEQEQKLAAIEKDRTERDAEAAKARAAAQQRDAVAFAAHVLDEQKDGDAPKFELCAKAENRQEAAAAALELVPDLAAAEGIEADALTPEKATALLARAYELVEAEYEEIGKRYSKAAKPAGQITPQRVSPPGNRADEGTQQTPQMRPTIDSTVARPGITTQPPKRYLTVQEAIERAKEKGRAALGR